jgi:hypothetical protein
MVIAAVFISKTASAQDGLIYPLGAAANAAGDLFVADRQLPGIWLWGAEKPTVFVQGEKRIRGRLNAVRCLASDQNGKLLVGDSATREVYRVGDDKMLTPLSAGDRGVGQIGIPTAIAVATNGDIYVADLDIHAIWRIAGGETKIFSRVRAPRGLVFDKRGDLLVVSHGADQVLRLDKDGKATIAVKGRPFRFPHNIAVDGDGVMYVTDGYARAVWRIAAGESPAKLAEGAPFVNPVGIIWRKDHLIVVDSRAQAMFRVTTDGKVSKLNDDG